MKPPSRLQSVVQEFRSVYETHVGKGAQELRVSELPESQQREWRKRDAELHPSSFPFCGLRHAYELLLREDDPVVRQDFGRDYYLPAGHVFHAALQKWIGFSGVYIGDWRCQSCGKTHKRRGRPKVCSRCGHQHLEYHELGGVWGDNIHWHTDGLFRTSDRKYWLVDFKSTSTYSIFQHRKTKSVFPYVSNRTQIESYTPLVEDLTGLEIEGWLLVYAARDKPNSMFNLEVVGNTLNTKRKAEIRTRLEQSDKDFPIARQVKERPVKVFRRLERTKLCEDRDYYDHFVHDQWDPCPLHKVCFGSRLWNRLHKAVG